jgi:2,3-dihydroxybenzoate-AMP ligase
VSVAGFVAWPAEVAVRYRSEGWWSGRPLDHLLRSAAEQLADHVAVVCGERRVTYRELDDRVDRKASGFERLGITARDRVVVQLPNVLELIETIFALFRLGAIPVMALPGHRRSEITYFCRHTDAKAYVVADEVLGFDYRALAREVEAALGRRLVTIVVGEPQEHDAYENLDEAPRDRRPVDASEVALLQLSGGSTGTPKLIPRTHDDYRYSVEQSVRVCGFDASVRYLVALPAAHNFPMSSPGILGCIHAGARIVLSPQPQPDVVFPLIQRESINVAAAVPPLARLWLLAARTRRVRFPSLRLLQIGGARLDADAAAAIRSGFECEVQQVFGMAEGLVCYTRLDDPLERILGTQGRPMAPGDEVRIVDDEDHDVAEGDVGHLLTRGPYTIRGYYDATEHNATAFTADGFYRTGDLVRRTADGDLVVEGRAKEQINRGGEKIAPLELEHHLLAHEGIVDAAVVGVQDNLLGERICAAVVAHPKHALTRKDVLRHLEDRGIATFKLPDRVELLPTLPKTKVGKIDKKQLAESLHRGAR